MNLKMDEHGLIRQYLAPLAGPAGLGLLDDAACLTPPKGSDLILTHDSFVEGIHFPKGHHGGDVAERLLRVNLSDLAAKGARPIGYLLALSLPKTMRPETLGGFASGLSDVQQAFEFQLLGGDITAIDGPMVVGASMIGAVPLGEMIRRDGATSGDDIWVSGTLGGAKLGCDLAIGEPLIPSQPADNLWQFEQAYWRPEIRLGFRKNLRRIANASIDISDGIMADAGHIARASKVEMQLNFDALPLSNAAQSWADAQFDPILARQELLSFGDDYEILFTASPQERQGIFDMARQMKLRLSLIGQVGDQIHEASLSTCSAQCFDVNGNVMDWPQQGYRHFT